VLVVVIEVAAIVLLDMRRGRRGKLRERFGPEYDRVLQQAGDAGNACASLSSGIAAFLTGCFQFKRQPSAVGPAHCLERGLKARGAFFPAMSPACNYSLSVFHVILLSIAIGASAQTTQPDSRFLARPRARHRMGQHLKAKGIPNFGQVTPTLYRGGQPSAEGFRELARMGIDIVVDTGRSKRDETLIQNLGMAYVSLPWYCPFPEDKVFARFIKITRDKAHQKIFVHCRLGDDRTGMMIAAYRMSQQDWTAQEAMQEMHEFGYRSMHHLMCPGLAGYEKSFPQRLENDPVFQNLR